MSKPKNPTTRSCSYRVLLIVFSFLFMSGLAVAQQGAPTGLGFTIADDVKKVLAVLNTSVKFEEGPVQKDEKFFKLPERGISVFFNSSGKVRTIAFRSPYEGTIRGIKIGDSVQKLRATLGSPEKEPRLEAMAALAPYGGRGYVYWYELNPDVSITMFVTAAGQIHSIYLTPHRGRTS